MKNKQCNIEGVCDRFDEEFGILGNSPNNMDGWGSNSVKSFLLNSHIDYLEDLVEKITDRKEEIVECETNVFAPRNGKISLSKAEGINQALDDTINTIKEDITKLKEMIK